MQALRQADCDSFDDQMISNISAHAQSHTLGPIVFTFDEVNYAEMPDGLDQSIRDLGLTWAWAWDAGHGYSPGLTFPEWAFPDLAKAHFAYDYEQRAVLIPVSQFDNAIHIEACRAAQQFISTSNFIVDGPIDPAQIAPTHYDPE